VERVLPRIRLRDVETKDAATRSASVTAHCSSRSHNDFVALTLQGSYVSSVVSWTHNAYI